MLKENNAVCISTLVGWILRYAFVTQNEYFTRVYMPTVFKGLTTIM